MTLACAQTSKPKSKAGDDTLVQRKAECCSEEVLDAAGVPLFLGGAQTKLTVGAADDPFEREADAVADAVQRKAPAKAVHAASGTPLFQRLCSECAERVLEEDQRNPGVPKVIQRFAAAPEDSSPSGADLVTGLAPSVRVPIERTLDTRLEAVRVHTGPTAQMLAHALGAKAFTHGHDIWLGARQRPEDLSLMAHEVTHVLQQTGGTGPAGAAQARPEDDDAGNLTPESQETAGGDGDEGGEAGANAGAGGAAGGADMPAGADGGGADAPEGHPGGRAGGARGGHGGLQLIHGSVDAAAAPVAHARLAFDATADRQAPAGKGPRRGDLFAIGTGFAPRPYMALPGAAPGPKADFSGRPTAGAGHPALSVSRGGTQIQRKEEDALDRALNWGAARLDQATGAVTSGVKAAGRFAGSQLMSLLRTVAPQVADIVEEGPINFAKRKINEALDAHLPSALGGFSLGELIDAVSGWLGEAASFAKGLLKGDAKACAAFAGMMEKLTQFVTRLIDNPVIKTFTGALTKVSNFVGKALKFVAAPVFDAIARQVSGAWSVLKQVASTVSGWISRAKKAMGALWDELKEALGFDGSSEDGVWAHIKKVGEEIWEAIKARMAPVIEPMKKVASVAALLTPMGQVHAIVKYGPKLVKVAQWIWDNGLNPAKIREAPEEIRGMLTDLTSGVSGFKGVLQSGLNWLSEKVSSLADAVLGVASSLTGLPLIGFAHDLFEEARKTLKTLVADIQKGAKDALAAIEATATRVVDFISPYKEVISSLILAIVSPPMIPLIFAGWAWRALPACVKVPILNFILDIAIAALNAIPEVPTFGVLWPLLKPAVMAFLGTLRAAEDSVKEQVSDKIAKVISGASPEFLIGFVKGFAVGVWEGITDPFKAIWMVLEGLDSATQYLLSLAGGGEQAGATRQPAASTPAPAPAAAPAASAAPATTGEMRRIGVGEVGRAGAASAPGATPASGAGSAPGPAPAHAPAEPRAAPALGAGTIAAVSRPPAESVAPVPTPPVAAAEAQPEYEADPAAALRSGAAMPESTRHLLERLAEQRAAERAAHPEEAEPAAAAGPPAETPVAPEDLPALKERAGAVAEELSPDIETVKGGFWDAVQEYFSGEGMSFDDMVTKLSEAWETAKTKISEGAAWLANKLMGFFRGGGAEGELGDKIGWLTGTIAFQVLLDVITAGTWAGAGPVLKGIAKFINWPMEALGEAFKLLKTLGKYLLKGLKSLGSVIKDAAAGAFKTVSKALGNIGERLIAFGEEILGKFGGKAAKAETKAVGMLGREGTKLAESKAGREALREAEEKAAQKLEQQAGKVEPHPAAEPKPEPKPEPGAEKPKTGETKNVDDVPPESPAKREASAAESGKLENDKLTPQQTRNETDRFRERPESLEGTAPHRKSRAGEHEWREETLPNGECHFCRYSPTKICVDTPELRASELEKTEKHVAGLEEQAEAQARAAAEARRKALAESASAEDKKLLQQEAAEARARAEAAQRRIDAVKGQRTKAATQERAVARADLKRAEGEAQAAKDLLAEQEQLAKHAEAMEASAVAAKKEAEAAAKTAEQLKTLEKDIAQAEKDLAEALKKNKQIHTPETLRMQEDLARQRKALAEKIEASKGLTQEARETLRSGTPFNGPGGAERERAFLDSLPPEAKGPNGTYVDYVTGETLPLDQLAVDHVVPVDQIFGMEGFGRLSRTDQQAILDMPQNLRFLEQSRNSSKQAKSLAEWLGGKTAKAPKLPTAQREALAQVEADARAAIEAEIAKRLKKAMP